MNALLDFFRGFADVIVTVIDFIISLFRDLISMIGLLGTVVGNIPSYLAWLPGELVSLLVLLFACCSRGFY